MKKFLILFLSFRVLAEDPSAVYCLAAKDGDHWVSMNSSFTKIRPADPLSIHLDTFCIDEECMCTDITSTNDSQIYKVSFTTYQGYWHADNCWKIPRDQIVRKEFAEISLNKIAFPVTPIVSGYELGHLVFLTTGTINSKEICDKLVLEL